MSALELSLRQVARLKEVREVLLLRRRITLRPPREEERRQAAMALALQMIPRQAEMPEEMEETGETGAMIAIMRVRHLVIMQRRS